MADLGEVSATYIVRLQLDSVSEDVRCIAGFLDDFIECVLILGYTHTEWTQVMIAACLSKCT